MGRLLISSAGGAEMEYFEAISDQNFVLEFGEKLSKFHAIEVKARDSLPRNSMGYGGPSDLQNVVIREADKLDSDYPVLRDYLSRNMQRIKSIAKKHSIISDIVSYPPALIGGPVIPQNIFDSVLEDHSHSGIGYQTVHDKLQAIIGACNEHVRVEVRAIVNPLHWFKKLLFFVLRIPFILIEATGFDVGKFENTLFGNITKAIILAVLIWTAMNWLGFSKDEIIRMIESRPK